MSLVSVRAVVALGLIYSFALTSLAQAPDPFGADPFGGPPDGVQVFDPFGDGDLIGGDDPFGGDPGELPALPKVKEGAKPQADVVIPPAPPKADDDGEARVEKALASGTTLEFIETPLMDVVDFLSDRHGIPIRLDERALNDVGIGSDTPITRSVGEITLRSALRLMLKEMDLTFVVSGGAIVITTPEESESDFGIVLKVYPVGHLLQPSDPVMDDYNFAGDELIDLITSITRPTTWEDVGGPGSVMVLRNVLIVANTREVQEEIAKLLAVLDQARQIVDAAQTEPPKVVSLPAPDIAERRILKALWDDVDCDFRETPLQDVVDFFKHKTKIEIQIDHRALEDVGIGSDTPITLKINGISMGAALRLKLREMDLVYVIRDEVLMITTPEEAESELHTRVFPVADLVVFDEVDAWLRHTSYGAAAVDFDSLDNLITTIVRPNTWEYVGGAGSMESWNGCLVLSQTDDVLDEVERILAGLRKLKAEIGDTPRRVIAESIRLDESESPKIAKLREALTGDVGMLAFKKTPLVKVMQQIAEKHRLPILIDWRGMEDIGIDPNREALTATLGGESISEALRRLLRPFDLTYQLRDEVIMITTPEEVCGHLITRIYPAGDLVLSDDEFSDDASPEFDRLIAAITATVRPTTWEEVGGPGAIEDYHPVFGLVISQTEEVHEEVGDLLAQIRKVEAQSPKEVADKEVAKPEVVKNKQGDVLHLKVYHLGKKEPEVAEELAEVIRDLVDPKTWKADDHYYLRPMTGSLIVRHTAATHRKIDRLLRELDVLPWPQFGGGGFGEGIDNGQGFGQGGPGLGDGLGGGVFDVPDNVRGNFGGARTPYDFATFEKPHRTIRSLSLPATDDRAAMPLRIYRAGEDTKDIAATLRELLPPDTWESPGCYLRAIDGKLIVRHNESVHRQVDQLLLALNIYGYRSEPKWSDGMCRSVIPVVGERR